MRGLIPTLLVCLLAAACGSPDGEDGAAPLSVGTMIAYPPLLPVGVQGMVAVTLGNVEEGPGREYAWAVDPAEDALVSPSNAPAVFFVPLEVGEYEVSVTVAAGERVADGLMRVRAASLGSGAAQTDADLDGLFDAWELFYFGAGGETALEAVAPDADPDGDGRNNLREQEDGSDPTVRDDPAPGGTP